MKYKHTELTRGITSFHLTIPSYQTQHTISTFNVGAYYVAMSFYTIVKPFSSGICHDWFHVKILDAIHMEPTSKSNKHLNKQKPYDNNNIKILYSALYNLQEGYSKALDNK